MPRQQNGIVDSTTFVRTYVCTRQGRPVHKNISFITTDDDGNGAVCTTETRQRQTTYYPSPDQEVESMNDLEAASTSSKITRDVPKYIINASTYARTKPAAVM